MSNFDDDSYLNNNDSDEHEVIFINKIHSNYSPILPVLKNIYFPHKHLEQKNNTKQKRNSASIFPITISHPLPKYNEEPTTFYLSEPINYTSKSTKNTNITALASHPLLPIYITATDKGVFSTWSYNPTKPKPLYDFFIEKNKENQSKNKKIKKIEFNTYGNQFLAIEEETNSAFLFEFDHMVNRNYPSFSLGGYNSNNSNNNFQSSSINSTSRLIKDACFLNSSGNIVSTNSDYHSKYSNLWDTLLPSSSCMVGEIYGVGGNLISNMNNQHYFAIGNGILGTVQFIDTRKMQSVFSFQSNNEEIKSMVISDSDNFLVTAGKEGIVKIWDISSKNEAILIDSCSPYIKEKNVKNINLLLKDGNLFTSGSNSIKLLRNNIY